MELNLWCASPDTAASCKASFPELAAAAIAQADNVCANRFLFTGHWEMERTHEAVEFSGEIDWNAIPFGDVEWTYELNRHAFFVDLGKAYRYTGEERYASTFARLIGDWIQRVIDDEAPWRNLETGLRCENWLRALELFQGSPAVTGPLLEKIRTSLELHAARLAAVDSDFCRLSNWGVLQNHGLLLAGLFLNRPEYTALAMKRLDEELHLQVFRDGSHWEQSPLYHCEVLHCAADSLMIAQRNGLSVPERFQKNVLAMFRALAAWATPDGRILCQSDSDDVDCRDLLVMGALLFDDGVLKYAAGDSLQEENLWDFGPAAERYKGIAPIVPSQPSTALPGSGNYMLRGGPEAQTPWLHFHCGCLGSGHGHADLLHIDVGAMGEDILIDSGRYTYVDTPLRKQLKLPAAHNTTRVDSTNFSVCVNSWKYEALAQPVKGEWVFTHKADYVSAMHLGYLGLPGGSVAVGRKVLSIKPGIFVVMDQFYAQGTHEYQQYFHFNAGEFSVTENGAAWCGKKASAKLVCLGNPKISAEQAPYSRQYNLLCQGDVLQAEKRAEGFASFVTVIAVGTAAELPDVSARLLPVTMSLAQNTLPDQKAQAVEITLDGKTCVVLVCHGETVSEVDLFQAGGYKGYGKAIVFTPEQPDGLCLAW